MIAIGRYEEIKHQSVEKTATFINFKMTRNDDIICVNGPKKINFGDELHASRQASLI